jgi:hypothetical protein
VRRLLLIVLLAVLPALPVPAAAAAGPCPPGQTALGGPLIGQGDGLPLTASVGIELTDAKARAYDVFADGRVDTVGRKAGTRYSAFDDVNRGLAPGEAPTDRTWGAPGAAGPLCFTSNPRITHAYVEVYPRRAVDADGDGVPERWVTDRSRYGAAAHYSQPVPAGSATTAVALVLPRNTRSQTGSVAGAVTYRGRPVPVAVPGCGGAGMPPCVGITTVRAFPAAIAGPACGVEGFSASADVLQAAPGRTSYAIHALAGGRCGAPSQSYSIRITCVSACGGGVRTVSPLRRPAVRAGAGTAADVSFG